jgi:hypothetical protein
MFDRETVNAFSGGYKISESGIVTLFGRPTVSSLKRVIAFPVSLSIHSLVRKSETVVWKGTNTIEIPYKISKLSNDWYDPIKLMTNIAIQRGWKYAPFILAQEALGYQFSLGYYSAFVDTLVQAFTSVNEVTLNTSEFAQISSEIQDKIREEHSAYETVARRQEKDGTILFYDVLSNSYRNEIVNFEPFSLFLISENSLASNRDFQKFQKSVKRFKEENMLNRDSDSLKFPYVGIRNHMKKEEDTYNRITDAFNRNDVQSFLSAISKYSQSLGYNLGVLSDFQKNIARQLDEYGVQMYVFNISEYSGSVLVFADSLELAKIKENAIRDYYNLTNRTIRIDELQILRGSSKEPVLL